MTKGVWTHVGDIDWQMVGSCLLMLDLILFALLATVWDSAGRRKLFAVRGRKRLRRKP